MIRKYIEYIDYETNNKLRLSDEYFPELENIKDIIFYNLTSKSYNFIEYNLIDFDFNPYCVFNDFDCSKCIYGKKNKICTDEQSTYYKFKKENGQFINFIKLSNLTNKILEIAQKER